MTLHRAGKFGTQRGRGSGRRGASTRQRPVGTRFHGRRLHDEAPPPEPTPPAERDLGPDSQEDDESDEDDDGHITSGNRPYQELLLSFTGTSSHPAKKRKLKQDDHATRDVDHDPNSTAPEGMNQEELSADLDIAIEPEEDPAGLDDDIKVQDEDSDDDNGAVDFFDAHFANPDQELTANRIKSIQQEGWKSKMTTTKLWKTSLSLPTCDDLEMELARQVPNPLCTNLKQRLREAVTLRLSTLDATQQRIAPSLFTHRDVCFYGRTLKNADGLRRLVCIHALNHIYKTRDRIIKNSYKLSKEADNPTMEARDQGFTRPKVLFLLPTRQSCYRMINALREFCQPEQQENRKRFEDAFAGEKSNFSNEKPADFSDLFEGNNDDMFRLGVKFTRKTIKFYAQFYNSDLIFASPLGLRMAMGSDEEKNKKKKFDADFLSSIEIVIVDQADALLMQNWEHIEYIFERLNAQPREAHGCDFSRVRSWYLEDWARHFRQTVLISSFSTPEMAELSRLYCHNWAGKWRISPVYPGVIQDLGVKIKQTFSRFDPGSIEAGPDARFKYFTSAVAPPLAKRAPDAVGTLVFIPSYLDFVRLRNYFATSPAVGSLSFAALSEYSETSEASRARSHFATSRHSLLLYSERAHHFRRYKLRGIRRVIFYGLPDNPTFYTEIAGGFSRLTDLTDDLEGGKGSIRVLFSKYDAMKLERIVGSERVPRMLRENGDTFDFV